MGSYLVQKHVVQLIRDSKNVLCLSVIYVHHISSFSFCLITLSFAYIMSVKMNHAYKHWRYDTNSPDFITWIIQKCSTSCQNQSNNYNGFFSENVCWIEKFSQVNLSFHWWGVLDALVVRNDSPQPLKAESHEHSIGKHIGTKQDKVFTILIIQDAPLIHHSDLVSSWKFSAWKWKVYDWHSHTQIAILVIMDATCDDITAESCRTWIHHSTILDTILTALPDRQEHIDVQFCLQLCTNLPEECLLFFL